MEANPVIETLSIVEILAPIQADLVAVEAKMRETMIDQHPAISEALEHLLASGGKRLRPAVALLASYLLDCDPTRAILLAAAVEMLHTATLVHDDLIDGSLLRRGLPTLNAHWSPAITVLTGDYLFARAAELTSQTDSVRVMNMFARTLMIIVNGEINQQLGGRSQVSREAYRQRIYAKTASLFALATEAAAILSYANERDAAALRLFGQEVGMAFQIIDDIFDFTASESRLGKPVGSDLRLGIFTLPVLCYLEKNPDDRDVAALLDGRAGDAEIADRVVQSVRNSGAIASAQKEARAYVVRAQTALATLPDNRYRRALSGLADYFVSRNL